MKNSKMNEWVCAIRAADTWIFDDKEDRYYRPHIMFLLNASSGLIIGFHMFDLKPYPHEVFNQILALSNKPLNKTMVILKPDVIYFGDQQLVADIKEMLKVYGIDAVYRKQGALIDPLIEDFTKNLESDVVDIPGLLSVPKVTCEMVACLFEHAKLFYQSKPWENIDDSSFLEVALSQQDEPYYVVFSGTGGSNKGLAVFTSWEKYEEFLQHLDDADWDPYGYHVFGFNSGPELSFEDMDHADQFNWPLPERGIYPSPIYLTKTRIKRPNFEMILWYQAALRAIPQFLDQFKGLSGQIKMRDGVLDHFQVETSEGMQEVRIKFYPSDMLEIQSIDIKVDLTPNGDEPFPSFDRRALEGDLNQLDLSFFGVEKQEWTPVRKAQELMYDAWDTPQHKKRIALAQEALKISPDCADAYVLLAEEDADSLDKSLRLYREGVAAGKRALGDEFFEDQDNIGHFWGILDTRPFMRALFGYAMCLEQDGKDDLAEECLRELLRLNPNDNQGVRYVLMEFLIKRMRLAEARELIADYDGYDGDVDFAYNQLLLAFEVRAAEKELQMLLNNAIEVNAFVPDFLTKKKPIMKFDSYAMVVGGKEEAAYYVSRYFDIWKTFPGALDWIKKKTS